MEDLKNKNVDLHIHTKHSDGSLTPEEIIKYAKEIGLAAVSFTDHETPEAYKGLDTKNQGIEIITGTELISTAGGCAIEILIYGFEYDKMAKFISEKCHTRKEEGLIKTERAIELLKTKGIEVPFDPKSFDFTAPKAWIIREFYKVLSQDEKFIKLAKQENPKLLEKDKTFMRKGLNNKDSQFFVDMSDVYASMQDIRTFCNENGALMFLAHPFEYGENMDYVLDIAKDYVHGIEVYHPTADEKGRQYLENFAQANSLMISGGSDYHGHRGELNSENVPYDIYESITNKLSEVKARGLVYGG